MPLNLEVLFSKAGVLQQAASVLDVVALVTLIALDIFI